MPRLCNFKLSTFNWYAIPPLCIDYGEIFAEMEFHFPEINLDYKWEAELIRKQEGYGEYTSALLWNASEGPFSNTSKL